MCQFQCHSPGKGIKYLYTSGSFNFRSNMRVNVCQSPPIMQNSLPYGSPTSSHSFRTMEDISLYEIVCLLTSTGKMVSLTFGNHKLSFQSANFNPPYPRACVTTLDAFSAIVTWSPKSISKKRANLTASSTL